LLCESKNSLFVALQVWYIKWEIL